VEYIHAVMLLHAAGKKPDGESLRNVLRAAGVEVDEARVKTLLSSLEEVNIEEVLKGASAVTVSPVPQAAAAPPKAGEKKEERKEEEEKKEEEAMAGLASLFG
jgi:large subunit ribosomal protein L12